MAEEFSCSILTPDSFRKIPWRNGKGETKEIYIHPAGSSIQNLDFEFRISSAPVIEDGPFSVFPSFERRICLLEGRQMALTHVSRSTTSEASLESGQVHTFAGDAETYAKLNDGPILDFNLIFRPERYEAHVWVLSNESRTGQTLVAEGVFDRFLAFCHSGNLEVSVSGSVWEVESNHLWLLESGSAGGIARGYFAITGRQALAVVVALRNRVK
jgi:uncharacterized protein